MGVFARCGETPAYLVARLVSARREVRAASVIFSRQFAFDVGSANEFTSFGIGDVRRNADSVGTLADDMSHDGSPTDMEDRLHVCSGIDWSGSIIAVRISRRENR